MDELTLVITALATGAAACLKPTAEQAIKDAYGAIKRLIKEKYNNADSALLESDLTSKRQQALVNEHLSSIGAASDRDLQNRAIELIALAKQFDQDIGREIGVDLEGIEAASLRIRKVVASGSGVKIRHSKVKDSIDISDVDSGNRSQPPDP